MNLLVSQEFDSGESENLIPSGKDYIEIVDIPMKQMGDFPQQTVSHYQVG